MRPDCDYIFLEQLPSFDHNHIDDTDGLFVFRMSIFDMINYIFRHSSYHGNLKLGRPPWAGLVGFFYSLIATVYIYIWGDTYLWRVQRVQIGCIRAWLYTRAAWVLNRTLCLLVNLGECLWLVNVREGDDGCWFFSCFRTWQMLAAAALRSCFVARLPLVMLFWLFFSSITWLATFLLHHNATVHHFTVEHFLSINYFIIFLLHLFCCWNWKW